MSLVSTVELLRDAEKNKYGIGAFNVCNLETLRATIEVGEEENSPLIIQTAPGEIQYIGIECLPSLVLPLIQKSKIPISLHLDHGKTLEDELIAIKCGFSSIMIDGSSFSFKQNIRITREVVNIAHKLAIPVEAELGLVNGGELHIQKEEQKSILTDPLLAEEFVQTTGIDMLAVAIGTAHGLYKVEPNLDFERLKKIREKINVPIVLHGSTGISESQIKQAINLGVSKVNFSTGQRKSFIKGLKNYLQRNPDELDLRKIMNYATQRMEETIHKMIRFVGSSGKA